MRLLLLIIFLISSCLIKAQTYNGQVKPITDYDQCYTGFVNGPGDTIWPMQFQKVSSADVYYSQNYYNNLDHLGWVAMFGDYYGVIDPNGINCVPFEYVSIKAVRNFNTSYFVVERDGKFGVLDRNGQSVLPLEYDEIYSNGYNQFAFYQGDRVGQFGHNFTTVLPAKFDHIEYRWEEYYEQLDTTYIQRIDKFYEGYIGEFKGLYDTLGNELVPPEYHEIDPVYPQTDCPFDLMYFRTMLDSKYGLYAIGKGEVISPVYGDLNLYYMLDKCNSPHVPIVHGIIRDDRKKKNIFHAIDLRSGQTSLPYDGIYYYQDGISFTERKGFCSIIDSTLQPLVEDFPYRFTAYTTSISGHQYRMRKKDDLLIISEYSKPKSSYHIYPDYPKEVKMGIYQFTTGKHTDVSYDRIELHHKDGQFHPWAYTYKAIGPNLLTIFDRDLNMIMEIEVKDIDEFDGPDLEYSLDKNPTYIIQNKEGNWGILAADGSELIPFEYVQYELLHRDRCDTNRFMMQLKDGRKGVIDEYGNRLTDIIYDSVACNCDGLALGYKDGKFDGYRFGKRIIENADKLSMTDVRDYNHSSVEDRIGELIRATSFYAVLKDTLYIYEKGQFVKMDYKRTRFDKQIQVYDSRYLINRSGYIIAYGNYTMQAMGEIAVVSNIYKTTLIDQNGAVMLELDGYYYITNYGGYYYARHEQKQGILDRNTFDWVIEPIYDDIDELRNIPGTFFLVRTSTSRTVHHWNILDGKGEQVLAYTLDHPIYFKNNEPVEFVVNGKRGLLSANMEVLIEPIYDAMFRIADTYWVQLGGLWGAWREDLPLLELQFPNVSAIHNGNKFVAFTTNGDYVFIDQDLSLTPAKKYDSLLKTNELRNHLGKNQNSLNNVGNHPYRYRKGVDSIDLLIDNYVSLLMIRSNTFKHLDNYIHQNIINYSTTHNNIQKADYRIQHTFIHLPVRQGRYYSFFEIDARGMIDSRYDYNLKTIQTSEVQNKTIRNFDMTETVPKRISLSELFIENSRWDTALDSAITRQINERQLFGVSCVDLNGILKEYKERFYIGEGGLEFYRNRHLDGQKITIPFRELESILKHPEDFGL